MLVFLDDSGDPGFKIKKGSSPCFVIALVIFDDHLEAETSAVEIKQLRRELHLSDQFEFKFSKCSAVFRKAFLTRIVDSKNNVLIQLADMVAGTLRRHAEEEKKDAIEYRTILQKRIEDVWNFG